jgi:uncharacterized membrane protein
VTGRILWANLHLLFWLSLVPFVTSWMGHNPLAPVPTASYGVVLWMSAIAYTILQRTIIADQEAGSVLSEAVGADGKGKLSLAAYTLALPLAFVDSWLAYGLYMLVAAMWLIPGKRIESRAAHHAEHNDKDKVAGTPTA